MSFAVCRIAVSASDCDWCHSTTTPNRDIWPCEQWIHVSVIIAVCQFCYLSRPGQWPAKKSAVSGKVWPTSLVVHCISIVLLQSHFAETETSHSRS